MKNTGICPKCSSGNLVRIPGVVKPYGAGNNIETGITIFSSVKVTRYLCEKCGFSEEWIDQKEDIEKIKKAYDKE